LRPLVASHGSTVIASAALDPAEVHGFAVRELTERLRTTVARLELGDPLVRASAPVGLLAGLADRGDVAGERLRLVAAEGAALLLAFAVFLASARRRETEAFEEQLATLGASRAQTWSARAVEAVVPAVAGTALAVGGLRVAASVFAGRRGLPRAFTSAALPLGTIAAMVIAGAAAAVLLTVGGGSRRTRRVGLGALELAALTALGVIVWQAATTRALDPGRLAARGADPVLLLVPALAFFAAAVVLLRVLPPLLRLAERTARHGPTSLRLALLTAARSPAQAAAATTFLAVSVGVALFSLDYRATLDRQAHDEARFAAGAAWRVIERGKGVAPLTSFRRVTTEVPTPALRLDGSVFQAYPEGGQLP